MTTASSMISRSPGRRFVTVRGVVLVGDLYRDALPREGDYHGDECRRSWTAHNEPRARRRLGVRQDVHPLDRVGSSLTRPVFTDSGSIRTGSCVLPAYSSASFTSSQRSPAGPIRVRAQPPINLWPCRNTARCPRSAASATGALGDRAFEVGELDRVVLGPHREPLVRRVSSRRPRHRP